VLVLPRSASREQWLAARRRYIGSSDIADILGAGRHGPFSVWADKTGRTTDDGPNVDMARGIDFEDAVVRHWRRYHPELRVRRKGLMRSTRYKRAAASIDRTSTCPDGRCITEVKTQQLIHEWGPVEAPEVPVGFQFQGQWQMFVLGVAHIHYLVMGPRWHIFERVQAADPELQEWMACRAARFWGRYVVTDTPPPAEARDHDALVRLWPEPLRGRAYSLDDDHEVNLMHAINVERRNVAHHAGMLKNAEAALQARVGDATEIMWPDGEVAATWRPTRTIDADEGWAAAHPEEVAAHTTRYGVDRALMDRLRTLPVFEDRAPSLTPEIALALALAPADKVDLAALVNGGPLPEGLRYRRSWRVKDSKEIS